MAMLVLPDVFERTWGLQAELFWPKAIQRVCKQSPEFLFMAEVYWDGVGVATTGFITRTTNDSTTACARACQAGARPFARRLDYQNKMARFLKITTSRALPTFAPGMHEAAAVITFLSMDCAFSAKGNSKAEGSAFLRIWSARQKNQPTQRCTSSAIASSRCSGGRRFER
jgi:hypothetical protein